MVWVLRFFLKTSFELAYTFVERLLQGSRTVARPHKRSLMKSENRPRERQEVSGPYLATKSDTLADTRILRMPEIMRRSQLSRTTIWRKVRSGEFPAPVQLTANTIGWYAHIFEQQWLKTRRPVSYAPRQPSAEPTVRDVREPLIQPHNQQGGPATAIEKP